MDANSSAQQQSQSNDRISVIVSIPGKPPSGACILATARCRWVKVRPVDCIV